MRVYAIGGYSEVGRNMTLLEIGEDAFIFDMGLYMPAIVELEEKEKVSGEVLEKIGALPDITPIKHLAKKVRAIVIGHAHLDHVGAAPYIAYNFDAPIIASGFTVEVLKDLANDLTKEDKERFKNKFIKLNPNSTYKIEGKSGSYELELVHITHSIPQSCAIFLRSKEGNVLYTNDYKVDNNPLVGGKFNYEKFRKLGEEGIKLLITEALYADEERKTYSEIIAREMLRDVMLNVDTDGIIATTFSSHIARLKSIVDFGKQLGREVLFFGRSLKRYVQAAINIDICPFKDDIKLLSFKKQMERYFKKVERNRRQYLVVCTGHQGEPGSVLDRLSRNAFSYKLGHKDSVIFSTRVIPTPINQANRELVESRLIKKKVRIYADVHVSGHAGREDMRDMIRLLNPEIILPSHGGLQKRSAFAELASEEGYKINKDVLLLENGASAEI
jgi:ribonuclease J